MQASHDAELFEQHEATQYREWEEWLLLNTAPDPPRRQQVSLKVVHVAPDGQETEQQMQMWVPRQCQGMLRLEMQLVEVAGASSSQASTVPAMVATAGEAQHDRNVEGMYANGRRWG